MKAFSNFFKGKVLEEVNSPFNGKIQVIEFLGSRKIVTSGLIQSGGVLKDIWRRGLKAIERIKRPGLSGKTGSFEDKRILILGLGGGTVAKLAAKKWPGARMVGIEIDPAMIKFGKKYFDLTKIPNLKIVKANAINWVKSRARCHSEESRILRDDVGISKKQRVNRNRLPRSFHSLAMTKRDKFDLILIDLYKGEEMPKKIADKKFLKGLKRITSENGIIVFNCLFYREHKEKAKKFIKKLEKHFEKISLRRALSNLMVFVED